VIPDLVVLGNLLVDDVVFPDGRTRMAQPGGAVLYAALAARLFGIEVGVVTWSGTDYPVSALEALAARGVDLAGVHALEGPGLRTWLLYESARRRVVHRLEGPDHAEASPTAERIPETWRRARAFHLAPMPFGVQCALAAALDGSEALVSVDPFEPLGLETLPAWRGLLGRVDALFLSEDEMELPGARRDTALALRGLLAGRLQLALYKRGTRGGLVVEAGGGAHAWLPRVAQVVDPTGAGDAFAAGFLAGRLLGEPTPRAAERGVVAASFAIEAWGPDGLLQATPEAAASRSREWFGT
jgi:ribokinase